MNTIPQTTAPASALTKIERRNRATIKLLFIAALVLLLQIPLQFVNALQQERRATRASGGAGVGATAPVAVRGTGADRTKGTDGTNGANGVAATTTAVMASADAGVFEAYRMVERALKHGVLVLALVFAAFFLFETLAGLRLHAVHYGLVGAAMCLFYLALLALGEVVEPGVAYVGAAVASSALVVLYSAAILRSRARAAVIGGLLTSVHGVLYIVLRMESYALLAGTATLFVAVGAVMWFTRNIDWHAQDEGAAEVAS
jgi:inner membrane protein